MTTVERRKFPFMGRRPDLADWLEGFPMGLPFMPETHFIRLEESQEEGNYIVKAELPGMDRERDVEITLERNVLTIHAERTEEKKEKERSEFRYGSFTRSVTLPEGVKEEDISATYDKGILTVKAPLGEVSTAARRIEVRGAS
jgi:HSP20 family molecular chaperone IbpA